MESMGSKAFCTGAVFMALHMANPLGRAWTTRSDRQKLFLGRYENHSLLDLPKLKDVLDGIATSDPVALTEWFAKKGFNMPANIPPGGTAVGSVFDLLVEWLEKGVRERLNIPNYGMFSTANLKGGTVTGWKLPGYNYPMFTLRTKKDGWEVVLVETDEDCPHLDLQWRAMQFLGRERQHFTVDNLIFPCVKFEQDVDISFLVGMSVPEFRIDNTLKKVRLRVDEEGAHAEAAVMLTMRGGFRQKVIYNITRPFYVIFTRKDLAVPPFVALCGPDSWQK